MDPAAIFTLQFVMSLLVFALIAGCYAAPWLGKLYALAVLTIAAPAALHWRSRHVKGDTAS